MLKKLIPPALGVCAAIGICVFSIALPAQEIGPAPDANAPPDGDDKPYEALARGPMHEAFANPYSADPQPGIIVEQQPPDPIDEIPPDEMPEGDNIVWIPGYWGWDPEASEFIWISGLWRSVPEDLRWVPGYWAEVPDGFQWVAGFWANEDVDQLTYLPEPPQTLEQGPNVAPPDGDYFWVPGCWIWETSDYQWRPGYWAPAIADWIWVPDQYVWTPYGVIFVAGHWDVDVIHRGVMFAPVVFRQPVYQQPGFVYTPNVVINTAPLLLHLFVSPGYSHYFYGNYYGYQPNNFGFYPWYAYGQRRNVYDPLLTYYQWSYAQQNVNLIQRLSSWNGYFRQNQAFRPPRTFAAQRQFVQQFDRSNAPVQLAAVTLASSLSNAVGSNNQPFAFTQVADPQRQRFAERAQSLRQFQRQRREFEVAEGRGAAARATGEPNRDNNRQPGQAPAAPQEQKLQLPEATAVAQAEPASTKPGTRDSDNAADDRRGRGERRRPPARPTPQQPNAADANPQNGNPQNGNRPDVNRPRDSRPDKTPGDANPAGPNIPGADAADRPTPGANRPDRGRPGGDRPNANRPGADDAEPPAIPRFGVGRNRPTEPNATPGDRPGAEPGASAPDRNPGPGNAPNGPAGQGRGRGRGGFDPFSGPPPGAAGDAGPDANVPGAARPNPAAEDERRRGRPNPSPAAGAGQGLDRARPDLPKGAPASPRRRETLKPPAGQPAPPQGRGNAAARDRTPNPTRPGNVAGPAARPGVPSAGPAARPTVPSAGPAARPNVPSAGPAGPNPRPRPNPGAGAPNRNPGGGPPAAKAGPGGGAPQPKPNPGGGPPQQKDRDKEKKPKG